MYSATTSTTAILLVVLLIPVRSETVVLLAVLLVFVGLEIVVLLEAVVPLVAALLVSVVVVTVVLVAVLVLGRYHTLYACHWAVSSVQESSDSQHEQSPKRAPKIATHRGSARHACWQLSNPTKP